MLKKMHKKEIDINKMKRAERSFINVKRNQYNGASSIVQINITCTSKR